MTELFKRHKKTFIRQLGKGALDDGQLDALGKEMLGKKYIGTFAQDESATASGMGLFEILGRVNHSCVPNARLESLAGESEAAGATLAATRDVELGEEVLIDYLANFGGTAAEKRDPLLEQYRFHCHCELCAAKG